MKKEKKFNIREINGTLPIGPWLERKIAEFAKREYGINIVVKATKTYSPESRIDRNKWIVPYKRSQLPH